MRKLNKFTPATKLQLGINDSIDKSVATAKT